MTKHRIGKDKPKGSECVADSGKQLKQGALDRHYIDAALEYPFAKKIDILRKAIESAELTMTATRQRAYELHERLRGDIDKELLKIAKDARRMGLSKLMELCESAESESVQATVATTLTKDLFPNVSVKKVTTIDDLEAETTSLVQQIAQEENKTVEQVLSELNPTKH